MSIISDNAANNDTMMSHLEGMFAAEGIDFNAVYSRGRCLPHTVHLAAIKVSLFLGTLDNINTNNVSFWLDWVQFLMKK